MYEATLHTVNVTKILLVCIRVMGRCMSNEVNKTWCLFKQICYCCVVNEHTVVRGKFKNVQGHVSGNLRTKMSC